MIAARQISVSAGTFRLANVSLDLPEGRYGVLMGKTGSGKTTLVEGLCGLRRIETGTLDLAGRRAESLPPQARAVGYVPQESALFRTMSVRDNLAFALVTRRWTKSDIETRVGELAKLLGIERLLDRRPGGLSGGEAQRVALGRALAFRPRVVLLDEPLSALDDDTRLEMIEVLKTAQRHSGATILHVTHHRQDAELLADVLFTLVDGVIHTQTLR